MMKSGKKMSPMEAKAKLASLKELMSEMDDMMMEDMKGKKGMAKVSVMSDSPEGLKKGLETAEGVLEEEESEEGMALPRFGSQEKEDMMEDEDMEDMSDESDDMSEDDLDRKIAELMAKKKSKQARQL
jgi:hypothetical protein